MTLAERADANLLAAYLSLGRALPGAKMREAEGYVALLSDLPHPSGNFASRLRLDPWRAAELRALAAEQPTFQAIALPGDEPAHLSELLSRAGFRPIRQLASMVAEPYSTPSGLEVAVVQDPEGRLRVGRFIADAFFAREAPYIRGTVAEALGRAPEPMHVVHSLREAPAAAASLTREAGILGLYNLCVAPPHRGKGLGRALVGWCLALAAKEGLAVCLQCVSGMEPWYARQGFVRIGTVTVWETTK